MSVIGGLLAAFLVGALLVLAIRLGLTLLKAALLGAAVLVGIYLVLTLGGELGL